MARHRMPRRNLNQFPPNIMRYFNGSFPSVALNNRNQWRCAKSIPTLKSEAPKKLAVQVESLGNQYPDKQLEIWGEDETRIGLLPIVRKVWAKRGCRRIAVSKPRYQWLYGFALVHPLSGENYWNLMPTVNCEVMSLALLNFARHVNPDNNKIIILLLDQAGFHTGNQLVVPPGIEIVYLPPKTPQLQPSERIWPLLREAVANRAYQHPCST